MGRVLFLQRRPGKGGAQHSLSRVLVHPDMAPFNPLLVTSSEGWLTGRCAEAGVETMVIPFPSPRSTTGRLWRNRSFAGELSRAVSDRGSKPVIIHGNDHHEALLVLELAKTTGAKSALSLRSPGMTADDYRKHNCGQVDLVVAVGDHLAESARGWDPGKDIVLIHNGVYSDEVLEPKSLPPRFPDRILVVGSHLDWKGWSDVVEALHVLWQKKKLPPMEVHFTGRKPLAGEQQLELNRVPGIRFEFLGHTENFRALLRTYDLVLNPTRMESFGMAAVETLAAGVPLISSRTGVIEQVQDRNDLLFKPGDPEDLARVLGNVMENWEDTDFNLVACQGIIRTRFTTDNTVAKLAMHYDRLING